MEHNTTHPFPRPMRTLEDYQSFHLWLDEQKGLQNDIFHNMILLTEEVGELARILAVLRRRLRRMDASPQMDDATEHLDPPEREALGDELADCLAFLIKIANNAEIDLQSSYLAKMARNVDRTWPSTLHNQPNSPAEESIDRDGSAG